MVHICLPPLLFAFLVLGRPVASVSLTWYLCVERCWPDVRLASGQPPPALSLPRVLTPQPPCVQAPALTTKHTTRLERQEPILFLLQVQTRAVDTGCPLGPEGDFRNLPSPVPAPWPFPFPAPLRVSERFQRPVSASGGARHAAGDLAGSRGWAPPAAACVP